ncbi:glycosyltransferase family 2 protein [Egicoccus halophilus]|uniref:Integral membrane regulatory protein n=1 Tax=Egicoccus halophilus TaxID=1670830 RepID=A0A8J3ETH1_9ACTN|nr:glycosyltransferase family 2 protein [Egicoccus halophilus]GGI03912.1 integral membrane regulatory protein [Egicoccus halophilus]
MPASSTSPAVLVVLVTHDGASWLPRTLAALAEQTHPSVDMVAVDNGSTDHTREILLDSLRPEQVLVAERDLGFGAAVSMALDARPAATRTGGAPYVLFLHDDTALAPDAVERLVVAMEADPRLAIVGPKQRIWGREDELQAVGWTVDLTGRADSGVDEGELDQGQRDNERRTLYVSTSGMLVRREVFDALGRFDRRYHLFRDDLDLCWRAWLAGHDVEVVPDAVSAHVAAATNYLRLGQTRFIGPRYFAERNTLATLLKNYGPARLALVVPLYFLVGIAKVFGFLLTRRVSDAWQTVRAWLWNVWHLRETLRLRREVQSARRRADGELRELFGRVIPRVRAYAEAIGEWVAGGDVDSGGSLAGTRPPADGPRRSAPRRLAAAVKRRPVLAVGTVLSLVVLVGAWPLLLPGELRGGELAPWPVTPAAFLTDYAAGWHTAGAFGTAEAPSPAQALLGLLHLLVFGSSYAAPRLLLLGLPLVAWLFALRAAQGFSRRRLPRVVAATAYVLSPPALAALSTGRVGALVVLAALPGIVAAGTVLARRSSSPSRAWRAVAAAALLSAIAAAFVPLVLPAVVLAGALVVAIGWARPGAAEPGWRRALALRALTAALTPVVLLLPWSWQAFVDGSVFAGGGPSGVGGGLEATDPLWRWLSLTPQLPGIVPYVGGAFVLAGLLGLVLGTPRRPGLVAGLWTVALVGAGTAWQLARDGATTWPGVPLLLTALAFAGLLALAFATAEAQLTSHAFGWRQLAALTTGLAVAVGLAVIAAELARGPWGAYVVDEPALPAFVASAAEEEGSFRVLVLADGDDGVRWEVVEASGPTMAAYGVDDAAVARTLVGPVVEATLGGADPTATRALGPLNVRYVLVPAGAVTERLDAVLQAQLGLEPRPIGEGRLFAVPDWLPRAALVGGVDAETLLAGELPATATVTPLQARPDGSWRGSGQDGDLVVLAEPDHGDWSARQLGAGRLSPVTDGDGPLVFEQLDGDGIVELTHLGDGPRAVAVAGQLLVLLLVISLALRPPRFARRRQPGTPPPTAPPSTPSRTPEVVA